VQPLGQFAGPARQHKLILSRQLRFQLQRSSSQIERICHQLWRDLPQGVSRERVGLIFQIELPQQGIVLLHLLQCGHAISAGARQR